MGKRCLTKESKALFPLSKIEHVEELFRKEIAQSEPNVAIWSIIIGALEHNLVSLTKSEPAVTDTPTARSRSPSHVTPKQVGEKDGESKPDMADPDKKEVKEDLPIPMADFPPIELDTVSGLYEKFQIILTTSVNRTLYAQKQHDETNGKYETSSDLIKNVSDVVWNSLSKSYQADKPHLQNLYTFLTGHKLDSFGVALAVVAGAQVLNLQDVHLTLSEGHSWVTFGLNGTLNVEVTWHGKGIEDKRGEPIALWEAEGSWLYLNGSPVVCDRHMEIGAVVAAINPTIIPNIYSEELNILKQRLLWVLFDAGHLKKYPMAIGNLAEFESMSKTPTRVSCIDLFEEAITSAEKYYQNKHVYPYIYYGLYHYRRQEFKLALKYWAKAADVMRNYKYTKNDEEIYTQFLDITKDYVMAIIKQSNSGISATSLLRDPTCFATLLRLFDGICQWEENSTIGKFVIHITWAKCWSNALTKFDYSARKQVKILCKEIIEETSALSEVKLPSINTEESLDCNGNKEKILNVSQSDKSNGKGVVEDSDLDLTQVTVEFTSFKMSAVKDLVLKEKLNTSALCLILSAQSISSNTNVKINVDGIAPSILSGTRNRKSKKISTEETIEIIGSESNSGRVPPHKRARKSNFRMD